MVKPDLRPWVSNREVRGPLLHVKNTPVLGPSWRRKWQTSEGGPHLLRPSFCLLNLDSDDLRGVHRSVGTRPVRKHRTRGFYHLLKSCVSVLVLDRQFVILSSDPVRMNRDFGYLYSSEEKGRNWRYQEITTTLFVISFTHLTQTK